jgi:hypothetical protein
MINLQRRAPGGFISFPPFAKPINLFCPPATLPVIVSVAIQNYTVGHHGSLLPPAQTTIIVFRIPPAEIFPLQMGIPTKNNSRIISTNFKFMVISGEGEKG